MPHFILLNFTKGPHKFQFQFFLVNSHGIFSSTWIWALPFKNSTMQWWCQRQALNLYKFTDGANKIRFQHFFFSLFIKFSHLHVYEIFISRLVLCNTKANLKLATFTISQKLQLGQWMSNVDLKLSTFKFHIRSKQTPIDFIYFTFPYS